MHKERRGNSQENNQQKKYKIIKRKYKIKINKIRKTTWKVKRDDAEKKRKERERRREREREKKTLL